MSRRLNVLICIFCSLVYVPVAAGCVKEKPTAEYVPQSIRVEGDKLELEVGQQHQLTAALVPAVAKQVQLQWSSSNDNIVSVENGLITALKEGKAAITVSYKNVSHLISVTVTQSEVEKNKALLFDAPISNVSQPDLVINDGAKYTSQGLEITGRENTVKLNRFYALAERMVRYKLRLSDDAKAIFHSSEKDFNAYIDVPGKKISIATNPVIEKTVDFLKGGRDYEVEIFHIYQKAKLRITDIATGQTSEIEANNDGQGGVGKGALQQGFAVGMQWDYYCFGLSSGTSMLVSRISVYGLKKKVKLILYGDSITQPEGYFPKKDFPLAWTQQIINQLNGNAISSGRGGAQIDMVANYIKNELPYIDAEYVMVTIGTNGGNTEDKLRNLVNYIKSQGAVPILNNIPSNESGTQVAVNEQIEKVRRELHLKGARFDLPTSLAGDGKEVDRATMYWEDYSGSYGWQIYHHPNELGGSRMFQQSLLDLPELYK